MEGRGGASPQIAWPRTAPEQVPVAKTTTTTRENLQSDVVER